MGGDLLKKVVLIFLSMVFVLSACQTKDSNAITLEEVLFLFEEQELSVKESKVSDNIFAMKLNGVRPSSYEIDGKMLSVYIYNSNNKRERGLEDFYKKTETTNTVSFNVYEVENVLIFYVYEKDLNNEIDSKIQNILSKIKEV